MSDDEPAGPKRDPPSQLRKDGPRLVAIVLAVFFASALFCLGAPQEGTARIDLLESPERSVVRVFERNVEIEQAAAGLSRGQRELVAIALETETDALRAAIDAYREVLARPIVTQGAADAPEPDDAEPEVRERGSDERAREPVAAGAEPNPRDVEPGADEATSGEHEPERLEVERAAEPGSRELARFELRARLAVLLAEEGRSDAAQSALEENERRAATFEPAVRARVASVASAIRCAYGLAPCVSSYAAHDLALLSPGWALERLRLGVARRTGDEAVARELESFGLARGASWRTRLLAFSAAFALPLAIGIVALLVWLWRGRPLTLSGSASIPPAWTFEEGFRVLVRAAGAGLLIALLLVLAARALGVHAIASWVTLCASLPMLWLVRHRLLRPHAIGFATAFGLAPRESGPRRTGAWVAWTLGLFAVGEIGARVIHFACTAAGAEAHWSESVLEGLLAGDTLTALLDSVDATAWAPIFEEIGCRALLYLTLRRRAGPIGAALASALLFGALHQSALPHFLTACWHGFVWAVAFERTRHLVPVIVGHALANAYVIGAGWAFYRP